MRKKQQQDVDLFLVTVRVFREFRGSFLCSLKNDPRIKQNNTKVLSSTFEANPINAYDLGSIYYSPFLPARRLN